MLTRSDQVCVNVVCALSCRSVDLCYCESLQFHSNTLELPAFCVLIWSAASPVNALPFISKACISLQLQKSIDFLLSR